MTYDSNLSADELADKAAAEIQSTWNIDGRMPDGYSLAVYSVRRTQSLYSRFFNNTPEDQTLRFALPTGTELPTDWKFSEGAAGNPFGNTAWLEELPAGALFLLTDRDDGSDKWVSVKTFIEEIEDERAVWDFGGNLFEVSEI